MRPKASCTRMRSVRAAKRILHLARNAQTALRRLWRRDYVRNRGKRRASARQVASVGVKQAKTEGLEHPRAAVVRGAAADSHDETAAPLSNRITDHFADAERRGVERIPLRARNERDAGRLRHLHDCCAAHHAIGGRYPPPRRTRHLHLPQFAAQSRNERLDRPFPAIGKWTHHALRIGEHAPHAVRRRPARLDGAQAPLERIYRKYNLHRSLRFAHYGAGVEGTAMRV